MNPTPELSHSLRHYLKLGDQPQLLSKAKELWQEAQELACVRTWQCRMTRQDFEDRFKPHSRSSTALQTVLGSCEHVYLLAVSLGEKIGQKTHSYLNGNKPLKGYLLDRMGSFMAEDAMKSLDGHLATHSLACGERVTRRFSPGYHDFSLDAQKTFLALIGDRLPGLRIGESALLLPEKTITAVKGIFLL